MPKIAPESTSKRQGITDSMEPQLSLTSLSNDPSSHTLMDTYEITGTPSPDSTESTSSDMLLVEPDHGLFLLAQQPTFDINQFASNSESTDLAVLIHRHYCAFQFPASLPNPGWTWKKAAVEIITLRKAFPAVEKAEDSILAMTAWFHFLCNIDDEIEQMDSLGRAVTLGRIIEALQAISSDQLHLRKRNQPLRGIKDIFKRLNLSSHRKILITAQERTAINSDPAAIFDTAGHGQMMSHDPAENGHAKALALASNFIRQCQIVLSPWTIPNVFAEVINVLEALKEESAYEERTVLPSVEDYLRLRVRTIGLSPFFAILENTLAGIEAQKSEGFRTGNNNVEKDLRDNGSSTCSTGDSSIFWTSPLHTRLRDCIQRTVGLQNDIVGLNKDIAKDERMNLAVLLVEQRNETTENLEAVHMARSTAVSMHNAEMQRVMRAWAEIEAANHSHVVQVYAESLVAFTRTHFAWAMHTNRYHVEHRTMSTIFSKVAKSTVIEGMRFKARVIRMRKSLQELR